MTEIPKAKLIEAAKKLESEINLAISRATEQFVPNHNEVMFKIEQDLIVGVRVKFLVAEGKIKLID